MSYWALGYALAFGNGGGFIGGSGFFGDFPPDQLHTWFFQMVFAATAATIVSGGVAERCEFIAYLTYSIVLTGKRSTDFCVLILYYCSHSAKYCEKDISTCNLERYLAFVPWLKTFHREL